MKKFLFLVVVLLFQQYKSQNQEKVVSEKEFIAQIDSLGLEFRMPEGFKPTSVKKNRDLQYSFAIINDNSFEIRYSIFPLKALLKHYEESKKNKNEIMINPNNFFRGTVNANVLNMTSGIMYEVKDFPIEAVKNEFNADIGGSCFLKFNCEFGKGYQFGQFIYLHKENVADVIVTFMGNNQKTFSDDEEIAFYSLKFKE